MSQLKPSVHLPHDIAVLRPHVKSPLAGKMGLGSLLHALTHCCVS